MGAFPAAIRPQAVHHQTEAGQITQAGGQDGGPLATGGCVGCCHGAGRSPGAPHDHQAASVMWSARYVCNASQERLGVARHLAKISLLRPASRRCLTAYEAPLKPHSLLLTTKAELVGRNTLIFLVPTLGLEPRAC